MEEEEGARDNRLPVNAIANPLELEQALSAKLGEIVPEPKKQEVTQVIREVVAASFSGPPAILREYDEISPGAADRIIAMAEKEQSHRHSWEKHALSADSWYSMAGIMAGWTTAIALAVGAGVAAAYGQVAVGLALAGVSATGMVWKLVQGRSEKPEKRSAAPKEPSKGNGKQH